MRPTLSTTLREHDSTQGYLPGIRASPQNFGCTDPLGRSAMRDSALGAATETPVGRSRVDI